jgi:type II secretory pathway predicted ATPase ExeA
MFQEFYGFTRLPFSKSIPTQELFASAGHKELSARLTYLIRERGLGLVTGDVGAGKSTAVRAFTEGLDANRYCVLYLANPTAGITGLYRELLVMLGHAPPFGKARMVAALRAAFEDLLTTRRRAPLVILDEAHLLTQAMLEELRLLFSVKMDSDSLATLLLVGSPDLRRTLHLSVHEPLQQRLTVRYHLGPLDLQETLAYVRHHVRAAGYTSGVLFTDDAVARVWDYTKGVPRRINQVCSTALMAGLIDQKTLLDETTIRKAVAEIDSE